MAETNSVAWSGTTALNILLRVPPLFVLDYVALVNFGSSPSSHFLSLKSDDLTPVTQATSPNTVSPDSNQDKIHYASGWPVLLHTYGNKKKIERKISIFFTNEFVLFHSFLSQLVHCRSFFCCYPHHV